jgi:hypothetical protein
VSDTALGAATCRLIEQYQPDKTRQFHDSVVKDLVGTPIRALIQFASMRNLAIQQMDAITPGIYGVQISRTRFIDDAVRDVLSQQTLHRQSQSPHALAGEDHLSGDQGRRFHDLLLKPLGNVYSPPLQKMNKLSFLSVTNSGNVHILML